MDATQTAHLNPAFRYLRIEAAGSPPALLVLGYVDAHPQGDIEVWYSAEKEVIKTQNGRIVGTAGLSPDWRNVRFATTPPSWAYAKSVPQSVVRVRDEMPGYRFGITEPLTLAAVVGQPGIDWPPHLPADATGHYNWYRESIAGPSAAALPASWYAVGNHQGTQTVVYSFQCLGPQLCLSLQRWPPEKDPS